MFHATNPLEKRIVMKDSLSNSLPVMSKVIVRLSGTMISMVVIVSSTLPFPKYYVDSGVHAKRGQ